MYDVHLSQPLDPSRVIDAVAAAVGADRAEVQVDDDLAPPTRPGVRWRCVIQRRGGDFPCSVSIYPQGPGPRPAERDLARRICVHAGVRALISDDTPNPFRWIAVDEEGDLPVFLDPDALDRDEWVLDRALTPPPSR